MKKIGEWAKDTRKSGNSVDAKRSNPCRHCGEQYFPDHRCKSQQRFKSLEMEGEEGIAMEDREGE